ncbi:MAG TPA: hypothetical protein VGF48_07805 [Thermoanaerobaculia bacterium]|jgi:hypothetical protein
MLLPIVAFLAVTISPSQPAVGDLVTVTFPAPVVLDHSEAYEVVSQKGNTVVVRTFEPKPFVLEGSFGRVTIPVRSVLKRGDDLKMAPLVPPRALPYPSTPWIAIASAAAFAALAWLFAWWRSRQKVVAPAIVLAPDEQYRQTIELLVGRTAKPLRWAALADATRAYLAATRPRLGTELTTTELLRRLDADEAVVREILQQGDLEKFSLRGPEPRDFDDVARRALGLIPEAREEQAA